MVAGSSVQLPWYQNFAASAVACCWAEATTLPIDTAKVRLQLQSAGATSAVKYRGLLGTVATVAKEEGARALWKGLEPGWTAPAMRIRRFADWNVMSGLATGAIAIAIASPTDLVKVRMQSEGKLAPGVPRRYPNAFKAYGIIAKEEGVQGMWKGVGPNVARNAIINAAEVATYDQIKETLMSTGMFEDNAVTHLAAGLGAGFFAVCCGSPVDVVKSRVMGDATGQYNGVVDCFVKTFKNDGIMAFYKGFGPNFVRLGSWNVIMFLTLE